MIAFLLIELAFRHGEITYEEGTTLQIEKKRPTMREEIEE